MANELSNPVFQDAYKARAWLEAALWPDGPVCGHCGAIESATPIATRPSWYQCNACRKQFSVTVGTLFERSHIPLNKWLLAAFLLCASKKGISTHQMRRMIGVSYKSTWFMMHRLREAMREGQFPGPLGGEGKTVEADETYVGGKEKNKHRNKRTKGNIGGKGKEVVFSLVERGGSVRSHHVPEVNAKTLRPILVAQIDRKSFLMTDEAGQYYHPGKEFAKHETVNHGAGEYVRGEAHSNTVENYFSILKRGITGTYHHVSQQHLKRYLAEFDFRYNERSGLGVNDSERATKALKGIVGKRLTYRRTGQRANV
ncbi:DDE transposase [Hypericibacter terrae]|uniref:DDE transposase n=1 Tax=Hypericibacter terrae TaxID=2602015 RepID=A0A5J6MV19_9PROT|nr:IS1595 family transposase [Hypericibacter terrae]QEX18616.1 DDE transposase [Hypericibacter terrae]